MRKLILIFLFVGTAIQAESFINVLHKHCLECHGGKKVKGDVNFKFIDSKEAFFVHYDMLKNSLEQVKSEEMPPEDDSKMTAAERKFFVDYLEDLFEKMENTATNRTGPTRVRRLTSVEYDNTVKAVTGLDLKLAKKFPADGSGGEGFNNDSAILGVSPLHFEKYLTAAQEISTYSDFDVNEGFSFGKNQTEAKSKNKILENLDNKMIQLLKNHYPKDFTIEKHLTKMMMAANEFNKKGRDPKLLAGLAKKYGFHKLLIRNGIIYFNRSTGKSLHERDSLRDWFKLNADNFDEKAAAKAAGKFAKAYEETVQSLSKLKGVKKRNAQLFINNIKSVFSFTDKEISQVLSKSKIKQYVQLKSTIDLTNNGMRSVYRGAFAKSLVPHIKDLLLRAHRIPPADSEVLVMAKDFITATAAYGSDIAARMFIIRTFASMKFIFRFEHKTGKPSKVTEYELASRLSYFLWSSPPDKGLYELAAKGTLSDPKNLEKQVSRMLKDKRSRALADNFASQWLNFAEILETDVPNKKKFPEFTHSLAEDMFEESAATFDYIVKNDRSVLEVIDADYTFLNDSLKRHYGMGSGSRSFTKINLGDKRRGGITANASVLTITSYPLRTSPVLRGNWILGSLMGTPPPPPPPNVPALDDEEKVSSKLTLKQQLDNHRKIPQCNNCHQKIDPLGFPLEHYDPIGRWRNKYRNAPIDAVGEFKTGKKINGQDELKKYLLKNKDQFLKNMSRKMLGYALGRKVYYYDYFLINNMVENLKGQKYRLSSMVLDIVKSFQFQHKN